MMTLYGITELTGKPAAGKTALALHMCRDTKTLYLSPSILRHRNTSWKVLARRFTSLSGLADFLACSAQALVQAFSIESVIIDGLDEFLYTVERPRLQAGEIFRITKSLRTLAFSRCLNVMVITSHYTGWIVDTYTIFNKYLGLRWSYVANTRYIVSRGDGDRRMVARVGEGADCRCFFKIDDTGVVFLEDGPANSARLEAGSA